MDPEASGSNSSSSRNSTSCTQKHRVSKRRLTKEMNDVTEASVEEEIHILEQLLENINVSLQNLNLKI
jgi:hypothetical protein